MAEAIYNDLLIKNGLENEYVADSAGTAHYHIGDAPDYRTLKILALNQITTNHKGRQFKPADFDKFDYIFVMDRSNLHDVLSLAKTEEHRKKVMLMREFDPLKNGDQVPDPYYGGMNEFKEVFDMLQRSCSNFIDFCKNV